jgi:hypothetical protein
MKLLKTGLANEGLHDTLYGELHVQQLVHELMLLLSISWRLGTLWSAILSNENPESHRPSLLQQHPKKHEISWQLNSLIISFSTGVFGSPGELRYSHLNLAQPTIGCLLA